MFNKHRHSYINNQIDNLYKQIEKTDQQKLKEAPEDLFLNTLTINLLHL